jgi:glycosyltransferase involved in cell wall biosynthesis
VKVLHVITTAQRRGAEMFASDLIPHLAAAGIEQRVAVLRGPITEPPLYAAPTRILANGRTVMVPGLRVEAGGAARLHELHRSWKPDLVQAHGGESLKYAALANWSRPIVYRRIGLSPARAHSGATNVGYRFLLRRCRRILAVAEAVRRETIDFFGIAPEGVITIPRGVDADRIRSAAGRSASRAQLGIPRDASVVLSLGSLSEEKDPIGHLEAMVRVRRAQPDAIHLIAGDGPLRGTIERRVHDDGLDRRARVLGSRSDVADLLAASDVLLLASRSEGMPGCIIEAGLAGVPVVAYAVAGVPEVVVDGTTGYTVRSGDLEALAQRIGMLLDDPDLRTRLGEAARDRCERSFEISAIAARYLSVYEEVLR